MNSLFSVTPLLVPIKFIQHKVHKYTLLLGEITAIRTGKRQG